MLLATTLQLSAQTNIPLYVDSFMRTGPLNGSTPDVADTNSAVWSATTDWTTSGTAAQGTNTSGTPYFCGFPITLSPSTTYRVSFDVNALATTSADPTTWIGLGFFSMSDSSGSVFNGTFVAWMLAKVNGDAQSFAGAGNWGSATGAGGFGGTGHFSVTVGVANDGSATVEYAKNGQVFNTASLTSSDVSQIIGVGMPIYNAAATVNNFKVEILLAPTTAVTLAPSNSVYAGTPVTVNAGASGAFPLTYQWLTDNGGATYSNVGTNGPTLTVDTSVLSGTYHYEVIATNVYGAVTSAPVALTVTPSAPMLSADTFPLAQTSYTGEAAGFSASFAGPSLTLHWQHSANANGSGATNLPGQTSTVLTLTGLSLGQSGYYRLQASNSFGGPVNSSWAKLTVLDSTAQTNAIYIDSFSRSGGLDASSPDVADSNAAPWSANSDWTTTGAAAQGVNTTDPYFCGFPITLSPSTTYQISCDVLALSSTDGDPTRWFGLGFFTSSSSSSTLWDSIQDALHIGQVNGYGQSFAGWGSWNTLYDPAGTGGTGHYSVTIAVAADSSATLVFGKNGAAFRMASLSSSDVGAIAGAGIMVYHTSATINNFRVESSVPLLPPVVTMQSSVTNLLLNWTAGATLLETTNLIGPWSTNASAPPLTITPTDPQHFYRVHFP